MSSLAVLKSENIAQLVFFIRGEKVILDRDLASLYGVTTKALNQAVKRNAARFPADFMFQLTKSDYEALRSQSVTLPNKSQSPAKAGAGDLGRKIEALEQKYDEQLAVVFAAIKELIAPPAPTRKQIGFHP
jgi:ORF6N domain